MSFAVAESSHVWQHTWKASGEAAPFQIKFRTPIRLGSAKILLMQDDSTKPLTDRLEARTAKKLRLCMDATGYFWDSSQDLAHIQEVTQLAQRRMRKWAIRTNVDCAFARTTTEGGVASRASPKPFS